MTSPRRLAAFALLTGLSFAACAKKDAGGSPSPRADSPRPVTEVAGDVAKVAKGDDARPPAPPAPTDQRKVIRTGRLDLVIASYDDTRDKLAALVQQAGGYIDSTQVSHQRGSVSSATVVLRIPSESFAPLLSQLRALGEITTEHTDAADVTDAYVDVEARLASAKVLEKRLLELASERTGNVENLLAVERELARVRGEIEVFEGKLRQWNDQISLSTLTLGLSTRSPELVAAHESLGQRISSGFTASLSALRDFGSGLAILLVALLPWLVLGIPAFLLGRRAWRRHARSRLPLAIAHPQPPLPFAPAPFAQAPQPSDLPPDRP